jgi:ABC-type nitrate/sulfonate/bicarbonate transport system substrate-binding protein
LERWRTSLTVRAAGRDRRRGLRRIRRDPHGSAATSGAARLGRQVTIGYQPGIGYAQLLIMKQEGWLQEALGGVRSSTGR